MRAEDRTQRVDLVRLRNPMRQNLAGTAVKRPYPPRFGVVRILHENTPSSSLLAVLKLR